jgi:hypothetical protein
MEISRWTLLKTDFLHNKNLFGNTSAALVQVCVL